MTPLDSKEDRVSDGRAPVVTVFNGWEERGQSRSQRAGLMTCGWEGGRACSKQTWKRTEQVHAEGQLGARKMSQGVAGKMSGLRVRVTKDRGDSRHGYRETHRAVPYTAVSSGN